MLIRKIQAKSILSKSKVMDYVVNPYIGCSHSCAYCYARFMKRVTGHKEPWGTFVDVKINAPQILPRDIGKNRRGEVWLSSVCDPYQPLEKKYKLTRKCLEVLLLYDWPVTIQTKSVLVLRDLDLLKKLKKVGVGFTISTDDDKIRKIFEPGASTIQQRIDALKRLHSAGVSTYAFIGPILPMNATNLVKQLAGKVDHVLVDRMNYHYADEVYKKNNLEYAMTDEFFAQKKKELAATLKEHRISAEFLF